MGREITRWSRYVPAGEDGYEVSTRGDRRFSAFVARLSDGRTIEDAYQLDVKGYRRHGNNWRLGKGRPPLRDITVEQLYAEYKSLWSQWADEHPELITHLQSLGDVYLTDRFASTEISQARALAEICNERRNGCEK